MMFWKKNVSMEQRTRSTTGEESLDLKEVKASGPGDMPETVPMRLVVQMDKGMEWVWKLKGVVRPLPEGNNTFAFRVFDEAQATARGLEVKNYSSLDGHPDLVLCQGWFDRKTRQVHIK